MLHARNDYNRRIQDSEGKIPNSEPVFLLRGQDIHAPALLDIYAAMSENASNHDPVLVKAVRAHAKAMREWHEMACRKVADMDPGDNYYD